MTFSCLITIAQATTVISFAISTTDLTQLSEIFLFSMTQVGFINKIVNFYLKSENVAYMDSILQQELLTKVSSKHRKIFNEAFRKSQKVLNIFLVLCVGVVACYGIVPVMGNEKGMPKNYPFPAKFPFNPDDYYFLIYVGEVVVVAVSASNNGGNKRDLAI